MPGLRSGLLAAMLLLQACTELASTAKPTRKPSASAAAQPSSSASPGQSAPTPPPQSPRPVVSASQPPPAAARLVSGSETTAIAGLIQIDAAYALSNGGARVVANNGSNTVALAEAGLIANNGGNIIANNGSTLISDKGAGLLTTPGGRYRLGFGLLQAAETRPLAIGTMLPAAGMLVGVLSLKDGQALPVGLDDQGQPAYAVYSDAGGAYTLYLPRALAGNVRVVARPPVRPDLAPDLRLNYDVVTPVQAAPVTIDEDTAQATPYLRGAFRTRLKLLITADDVDGAIATLTLSRTMPEFIKEQIATFGKKLNAEAKASGLAQAPDHALDPIIQRIMDAGVRETDIESILASKDSLGAWRGPPAPAVTTLVTLLKDLRLAAAAALAKDPAFFEKQAYFQAANAERPPEQAFVIKKPSDVAAFLFNAYLVLPYNVYGEITVLNTSLGVGEVYLLPDGTAQNTATDRLSAAFIAVINSTLLTFLSNKNGVEDEAIALIRAYRPTAP